MAGCRFFLQIQAPNGLTGIRKHLADCSINLKPWTSGYNGKVILRSQFEDERFEWNMDSSDTDVLAANGAVFLPVDEAWALLKSLSDVLIRAGFPHELLLDDEEEKLAHSFNYLWQK
jgi:hypothetical protein